MIPERDFIEAIAIRESANIFAINDGFGTHPSSEMYEQASRDLDALSGIPQEALDSLVSSLNILAELRVLTGDVNYERLYRAMKGADAVSPRGNFTDSPKVTEFMTPEVESKIGEYTYAFTPYASFAIVQLGMLYVRHKLLHLKT